MIVAWQGVHYVSCSPFRVPIARLGAAQVHILAADRSTALAALLVFLNLGYAPAKALQSTNAVASGHDPCQCVTIMEFVVQAALKLDLLLDRRL